MKDQIKIQSNSDKFQEETSFIGDQLQSQDDLSATSFKNADSLKRTLPVGMQKKINPRLFIL